MSDITGMTLNNRYKVIRPIGRGGMAEVYQVWDKERAVPLALKLLHEDLAEDPVFLRRFQREGQTLAKLQHPHIVRFYGLEQDDLLAYILMDYVDGTNLRSEILRQKGRGCSAERILEVMRPVCSALHYAHNQGLAHCDIKPGNIMIHKNGTVLVSDFGIARMTETSTTTTLVGAGTPAYMAPEQIRGEAPTAQTDIYALGIVLYEMLTGGERPFTGEQARITGSTGEKVRWEHLNVPALSPVKNNPNISPALQKIVLRCLEKDPAKRFASAIDLLFAVEATLQVPGSQSQGISLPVSMNPAVPVEHKPVIEQPGEQRPTTKQGKKWLPWVLMAIMAGIFVVVFMIFQGGGLKFNPQANLSQTQQAFQATVLFSTQLISEKTLTSLSRQLTEEAQVKSTEIALSKPAITETSAPEIPTDTPVPPTPIPTNVPLPTNTPSPILLEICKANMNKLCIQSFGETSGKLLVTLKNPSNFSGSYSLSLGMYIYTCYYKQEKPTILYCFGQMHPANKVVYGTLYSLLPEIKIADGDIMIPALQLPTATSAKPPSRYP